MSKQDPSKPPSAPQMQYGYGIPQQYGSMPPPYSAVPPTSAASYGGYPAQAGYIQHPANPYGQPQQQYVYMPQMQGSSGSSAYPRQQFMPAVAQAGPPPPYTPVAQPMMVPQQTVVVGGAFDAGARFDGTAQQRVPPPPPGVAPNAAQLASMQGHTVIGTQQRSDWFTGGSGGGSSFF